MALVIAAIHYMGPSSTSTTSVVAAGLVTLYVIYTFAARYFSRKPAPLSHWDLVLITAVIDPLMLSGWLLVAGESSTLFVGFYLFTILGFGFRVGAVPMHVCQAMSLAGFTAVVLASDVWQGNLLFALSHVILLIVVPIYAASLIRKIQTAKALAERESRAKSQLLAKVSHELRTPLTGITAAAQLVEVDSREQSTVTRARSILQLAASLDSEITQLLDLSRIEARRHDDAPASSFSMAYTATHVLKAMQSIAASKPIQVLLEYDERIQMPVIGRPQELTAVLMNLAGNAVKFTEHGAVKLQVTLLERQDKAYRIRFAVSDTGIGIAPQHHQKIFEPFFQVEEGSNRKHKGTGLGTSIAMELVRQMGGTLMLESALGKGSVFSFELALPFDASEDTQDAAEEEAMPVTGKRILVADDNAMNLALMKEMLLKDGHLVTAVDSGQDAIRKLSTNNYDVVFLDYNMGDVDGAAVYQTYSYSRINLAPTFFVTADTTAMTTRMLEDVGATGIIYKPVTFEKIRAVLAGLFPEESTMSAQSVTAIRRRPVELAMVPDVYVDPAALDTLREIKDTPEFLGKMLGDGIQDIESLLIELLATIAARDVPMLHRQAHAMKGVALNIGAVRLASLSDRLMTITSDALNADPARWQKDLADTARESLKALNEVREAFLRPKAVSS